MRERTARSVDCVGDQSALGSMFCKTNSASPCRDHFSDSNPNHNHGDVYSSVRPPHAKLVPNTTSATATFTSRATSAPTTEHVLQIHIPISLLPPSTPTPYSILPAPCISLPLLYSCTIRSKSTTTTPTTDNPPTKHPQQCMALFMPTGEPAFTLATLICMDEPFLIDRV